MQNAIEFSVKNIFYWQHKLLNSVLIYIYGTVYRYLIKKILAAIQKSIDPVFRKEKNLVRPCI